MIVTSIIFASLFAHCLAASVPASSATETTPCRAHTFKNTFEANGHCFFEPPDRDQYLEFINVKQPDQEHFLFSMKNSREVCKNYSSVANVLHWDVSQCSPVSSAIMALRVLRLQGDTPVDCLVENHTMYCDKGFAADDADEWGFVNNMRGPYVWKNSPYPRESMVYLICHEMP